MGISNVSNGLRSGVCTSSTRPSAPYEGQMIYETDTDMVALWNGSAWRYIAATTPTNGTVLQIVEGSTTTVTSSSSATFATTGLEATITPKSTSSKVLIHVSHTSCSKSAGNGGNSLGLKLQRNTSDISTLQGFGGYTNTTLLLNFSVFNTYLDSPSSTSALTYRTVFNSPFGTGSVTVQTDNIASRITLIEVAA
jgi:hypothetical protein